MGISSPIPPTPGSVGLPTPSTLVFTLPAVSLEQAQCGAKVVDFPEELPAEAQEARQQLEAVHHQSLSPSTCTSQVSPATLPQHLQAGQHTQKFDRQPFAASREDALTEMASCLYQIARVHHGQYGSAAKQP